SLWLPDGHALLRRPRVADRLLADGERLEEHRDLGDPLRHHEEIVGSLGVALRAVPVQPGDAALRVGAPETHVRLATRAVRAAVRPAHAGHDWRALAQRAAFPRHPSEGLVSD